MDNMGIIKKLPTMLSGWNLDAAMEILPDYDPEIIYESDAARLIALSDIYRVFVPNQMSREIYSKLYLALLRSLQKKEGIVRTKQGIENQKAIMQKNFSGIIGGWEVAPSLSLYVPRTEEIVGVNDNDFVCPDSLKQYYRCIRRYNHKCPECGSRMKKAATEQEESMLPCPKCGAVCCGQPVLWD